MPSGSEAVSGKTRALHFLTFSCYRRQPFLASGRSRRDLFELALEQSRIRYEFFVTGYVVMPEHVHLLMSEPERGTLASAVQAMKQSVSRKLIACREHFWQARYYDFNVFTAGEANRETEVPTSQSSGAGIGGSARGLVLEQLSPLCDRWKSARWKLNLHGLRTTARQKAPPYRQRRR